MILKRTLNGVAFIVAAFSAIMLAAPVSVSAQAIRVPGTALEHVTFTQTLRFGMTGDAVMRLQEFLAILHYDRQALTSG